MGARWLRHWPLGLGDNRFWFPISEKLNFDNNFHFLLTYQNLGSIMTLVLEMANFDDVVSHMPFK